MAKIEEKSPAAVELALNIRRLLELAPIDGCPSAADRQALSSITASTSQIRSRMEDVTRKVDALCNSSAPNTEKLNAMRVLGPDGVFALGTVAARAGERFESMTPWVLLALLDFEHFAARAVEAPRWHRTLILRQELHELPSIGAALVNGMTIEQPSVRTFLLKQLAPAGKDAHSSKHLTDLRGIFDYAQITEQGLIANLKSERVELQALALLLAEDKYKLPNGRIELPGKLIPSLCEQMRSTDPTVQEIAWRILPLAHCIDPADSAQLAEALAERAHPQSLTEAARRGLSHAVNSDVHRKCILKAADAESEESFRALALQLSSDPCNDIATRGARALLQYGAHQDALQSMDDLLRREWTLGPELNELATLLPLVRAQFQLPDTPPQSWTTRLYGLLGSDTPTPEEIIRRATAVLEKWAVTPSFLIDDHDLLTAIIDAIPHSRKLHQLVLEHLATHHGPSPAFSRALLNFPEGVIRNQKTLRTIFNERTGTSSILEESDGIVLRVVTRQLALSVENTKLVIDSLITHHPSPMLLSFLLPELSRFSAYLQPHIDPLVRWYLGLNGEASLLEDAFLALSPSIPLHIKNLLEPNLTVVQQAQLERLQLKLA